MSEGAASEKLNTTGSRESHLARPFTSSSRLQPQTYNMNGMNGIAAPAGLWQEARNSDGRIYYFNTQTKVTQWDKPVELMNPAEVRCLVLLADSIRN